MYNNDYLEFIDGLLDNMFLEYPRAWSLIYGTTSPKKISEIDVDKLLKFLQEQRDTELSEKLNSFLEISPRKLGYEITRNLSSFTRDNQEMYYKSILVDFMYQIGVNKGAISLQEESVKKVEKVIIKHKLFPEWGRLHLEYTDRVAGIVSMLNTIAETVESAAWPSKWPEETAPANEANEEDLPPANQPQKDRFVMKDQIMLLNELGVFDLPAVKGMTTESRGILFARMLNLNEKNVTETIRNCDRINNKRAEQNPYIYPNKISKINKLLESVRFKKG